MRIGYFLGLPLSKALRKIITDSCISFDSGKVTKYGLQAPRPYYNLSIPAGIRSALDGDAKIIFIDDSHICEDFRQFLIRKQGYPFYLEMDEMYELPYDYDSYCFYSMVLSNKRPHNEYISPYSEKLFSNIGVISEMGPLYTARISVAQLLESDLSYRIFKQIRSDVTLYIKGLTYEAMKALCAAEDINKPTAAVELVTYTGKRSINYIYNPLQTIEENIENIRRRIAGIFEDLRRFGASWNNNDAASNS